MIYALFIALFLVSFLIILNGFLNGRLKSKIDMVLGGLLAATVLLIFLCDWRWGIASIPLALLFARTATPLARVISRKLFSMKDCL